MYIKGVLMVFVYLPGTSGIKHMKHEPIGFPMD